MKSVIEMQEYGAYRLTCDNEIRPDWRSGKFDTFNIEIRCIFSIEQNWTIVSVIRILQIINISDVLSHPHHLWARLIRTYQDLSTCKSIIPSLAISIDYTSSIDLDIFASPFPPRDRVLERVVEVIVLPVCNVVGEL